MRASPGMRLTFAAEAYLFWAGAARLKAVPFHGAPDGRCYLPTDPFGSGYQIEVAIAA